MEMAKKTQENACTQKKRGDANIDIYHAVKACFIKHITLYIPELAVQKAIEALDVELDSNCPGCFQLAVTDNVLVTEFEVFLDGGGDLSLVDQNIVENTGSVWLLACICLGKFQGKVMTVQDALCVCWVVSA